MGGRRAVDPRTVAPRHVDIVTWVLARLALLRVDEESVRLGFVDRY